MNTSALYDAAVDAYLVDDLDRCTEQLRILWNHLVHQEAPPKRGPFPEAMTNHSRPVTGQLSAIATLSRGINVYLKSNIHPTQRK
jgi:hypothetical protein